MHFIDLVVVTVISVWLIAAIWYIMKRKKAGRHCCGNSRCGKSCTSCTENPHGVKLNENTRSSRKLS